MTGSAQHRAVPELSACVGSLRPWLAKAGGLSLVAGLLSLAPLAFIVLVYDRVVTSRNAETLVMLVWLMLLVYAVAEACEWAASETLREAGAVLDHRLAVRCFGLVYTQRLSSPAAGTLPLSDLHRLSSFLVTPQAVALLQLPVVLCCLALIAWLSPTLCAFALGGLVLQSVLAYLNERATQAPLQEANRLASSAQRYAEEGLRAAEVVQALGMGAGMRARWAQDRMAALAWQQQASEASGHIQAAARWVASNTLTLMMALGALLMIQGEWDKGRSSIFIAALLSARAMSPLLQLITGWRNVVNVRDAFARLTQALHDHPPKARTMSLPAPQGHLKVEALVAGAPAGGAPILRGVAFELHPGQILAVMGHSGSGKSTLARLLIGLWPAMQGKVRLDGVDIHSWNKAELGPFVGYVGQTVDLIEGSVAENIARFAEPDPALVEAAARAVGIHHTLTAMAQGYATQVGPNGAFLSGGQRQRVALARALYGHPRFVVLDEPNASLDEAGDHALLDTLQALRERGTTVVVVTHRPGILQVADRMLLLHEGVQQAFGTPQQVLASINQALAAQHQAESSA
jgi:ATP-binding cassette subfamily C exporter for protease/lipase